MDYQVHLETFHGPLDLLLYLVKRDEVDLRDIAIARVAEQFVTYLNLLQMIDIEGVGEFLVMAATLMELKSRMLLPRPEEFADNDEDPRQELVRQLIEYKRFKDAATLLESRAEEQSQRRPRQPPPVGPRQGPAPLRPVELWDLVSAFGRLLRETMSLQPQQISVDPTPLPVFMDHIAERLDREGPLPLSALFSPPRTRGRLIGFFLAILELIRSFRAVAVQDPLFGDIAVSLTNTHPENNHELPRSDPSTREQEPS